jgi:diguanylate cyclase (GGDEF)-like protein/PAS domain S-box-containing protein
MNELHNLLKRQLRRFTSETKPSIDEQTELLQAVNDAYLQFDEDRRMLEHSLELTSRELLERNAELTRINAELEKRVEERTASLQSSLNFMYALNQVAQSVLVSEDLQHVLKSIVDVVPKTISADRATLILFDHEKKEVTNIVSAGPGAKEIVESVSYDELMEGLTGWVMREIKPAFSPKDKIDPRESPAAQKRRAETNCGCIIVLPLSHMGETFGTMTVINQPEQPDFTQQEVTWLEIITTQASTAIGRTQIYDQLKKANLFMEQQGENLKQELSDRQQAEAALAAERDLLQALMDNIPDTIYFKDTESRFTRINHAQVKVLGVASPEEVIGKTDLDFQDNELAQGFYEEEQKIIGTGQPLIDRIEFNPTADGRPRWFSATKVPIKDENGRVTGIVGVSRDISDRKESEEALRQSEERFRLASWATKDALWDRDMATNQISWGAGLQKVFHYSPETTQTNVKWWYDHIHPQDQDKVNLTIDQALEGGMEFWSKEYRFQLMDGTYAAVMDRGYILRDHNGTPYRMIGAMMDITERKQDEETIRHQNEMLSSLHQITLDLLKHRNIDQLLNALVEISASFLDTSFAEIMLAEGDTLIVKAATKNQSNLIGRKMNRSEAVLSWHAFDTREPVVLKDYASWQHRQDDYDEFSLYAAASFPILNDEQCLGVLGLGRDKPGYDFTPDQIQFGHLFANLTALVINNVQLREALHEQSIHDPLTGLFNRRYMEEAFKQNLSRATRQLHTMGIIMLDIDHFKQFNDTHGHPAGDALLCEVGKFLQDHLRAEDVACRYGGEEFLLIMPGATLESTLQRAEHLRQEVKGLQAEYKGQAIGDITLSLGIAIYPEHGSTQKTILRAADDALYRAKQGGRDRVMLAEREG